MRKELEAQGCRVVPGEPWPNDAAAAEQHLRDALASARLSIHLLGATPGSDASGLTGLARLQLDLAARRGADDPAFRRLIWLPDRLVSADAAQTQLIESLERGEGLRAQDELVRAGAEGFKEIVRDELTRLAGTAAKPSRVYLICDAVDEAEALALQPRLVEAGFEVELPEFGPGGTVPAEEHARCLTGCETVLLVLGPDHRDSHSHAARGGRGRGRGAAPGRALRGTRTLPGAASLGAQGELRLQLHRRHIARSGRIQRAARQGTLAGRPVTALSAEQPYPGLRPFDLGDEAFFFGREAQTRALREKLKVSRLIAVVGRSGCGKSSLVRAGLVPQLLQERGADDTPNWRIATFRPQGRPLRELADALLRLKAEMRPTPGDSESAEMQALRQSRMEAMLRRNSLGLVDAARELNLSAAAGLLIIVDQFEEIFRFEGVRGSDADEATAFVRLLLAAMNAASPRVYVILTMRLDFLGDCARFQGLPEALSEGQFLVPNLSRAERRAAIEEPAKKCGGTISPAVTQRLLNEIGDDPDQLPVLQHVLMRTWQEAKGECDIQLSHYEATGGIGNAISRHADDVFEKLRERRAARHRRADVQGDLRTGPARPRDPPAPAVRRHRGDQPARPRTA